MAGRLARPQLPGLWGKDASALNHPSVAELKAKRFIVEFELTGSGFS